MEYYLAIKRNEVLICATTWVNLADIMLSDGSQTQRSHIVGFCSYEMSRMGKSMGTSSRLVGT